MSTGQISELDRVCDQVEQLLQVHEALQRSHMQLQDRVAALLQEREQMQARIDRAASRIDAVLIRLPSPTAATGAGDPDVPIASAAAILRGRA